MQITVSAIGKIGNSPIKLLIDEYLKRIPFSLKINEFQSKIKSDILRIKEEESKLLLSSCNGNYIIILDEKGIKKNSYEFANMIRDCQEGNHNKIAFIIGGAYGHGNLARTQADLSISLSDMTFPHNLARLILIEQIYRAYTINNNHPYHKE